MPARFAELMALSASNTAQSLVATQHLLEEKKRKEEQRMKEQRAREERERELHANLLRRRLEEEQRATERRQRVEEERARKEAALQRREEQQRLNLMYGKDKRSALPGTSGSGRSRKGKSGDEDDGDEGSSVLTREEKRMRRLNMDLSRSFTSKRKEGSHSPGSNLRRSGSSRTQMHEIIDAQKDAHHRPRSAAVSAMDDDSSRLSLRKQLSSMPTQLIKLNTKKRDTRTIDEILTDMQRAKEARVIAGDDAKGFKDWFSAKEKAKEREKEKEDLASAAPSPAKKPISSRSQSRSPSAGPSAAEVAARRSKNAARLGDSAVLASSSGRSTPVTLKAPEKKEPRTKVTMIKPERRGSIYFDKFDNKPKVAAPVPQKAAASNPSKASFSRASSGGQPEPARSNGNSAKRKRSYSPEALYDSDDLDDDDGYDAPRGRLAKQRPRSGSGRNDISSEIWALFGKDRNRYMQNDVYSDDDDDMEVDADALRREELRSARIAKREDEEALEAERRHEEAKRRKKLMKDRKGH